MKSKENRLHLESIDVCHVSHHNISLNQLSICVYTVSLVYYKRHLLFHLLKITWFDMNPSIQSFGFMFSAYRSYI